MNNAYELFTAVPKQHNCAQAVADGFGDHALSEAMKVCGGGNAPYGRCGALHAALLLTDQACHEELIRKFTTAAKSEKCKEIKGSAEPFPCAECVRLAAELVEKFRS